MINYIQWDSSIDMYKLPADATNFSEGIFEQYNQRIRKPLPVAQSL